MIDDIKLWASEHGYTIPKNVDLGTFYITSPTQPKASMTEPMAHVARFAHLENVTKTISIF